VGYVAAPAAAMASEPAHGEHAGGEAAGGHGAPHVNWFSFDYKDDAHKGPPLGMAILNFAVLVGLLTMLFGPKLRKFLVTRHDTIKRDLEEGRRLREEALRKLKEYETKLAGVDAEVAKLIAEIRRSAEDEKARIIADAEAHAAKVKRDAEDRIAAELDRARRLLEREVVDAAIAAAAKIIKDSATPDDQKRMVDDFIGDVQHRVEAQP
jgi:F-type H+-transporting ATPase subunit b